MRFPEHCKVQLLLERSGTRRDNLLLGKEALNTIYGACNSFEVELYNMDIPALSWPREACQSETNGDERWESLAV